LFLPGARAGAGIEPPDTTISVVARRGTLSREPPFRTQVDRCGGSMRSYFQLVLNRAGVREAVASTLVVYDHAEVVAAVAEREP
jgi:hypothetical protein